MYPSDVSISFSPNKVSPNTAFDFVLTGAETEDYAHLFDTKNYKLDVMFSNLRLCTNTSYFVGDESSATRLSSTSIKWTVGSNVDRGIYAVCVKITNAAG